MARAVGVTCDLCKKFEVTDKENKLPEGWIIVQVVTGRDQSENGRHIEVCGNRCLRDLGNARYRADRGLEPKETGTVAKRAYSEKGKEGMRRNGLRMAHNRGSHAENPHEDCPMCINETEPTNA